MEENKITDQQLIQLGRLTLDAINNNRKINRAFSLTPYGKAVFLIIKPQNDITRAVSNAMKKSKEEPKSWFRRLADWLVKQWKEA